MTGRQIECPQCAVVVSDTDRFCERCGAVLSGIHRVAIPRGAPALGGAARVLGLRQRDSQRRILHRCGERRAEPDRDEAELRGVALITDRGLEHARNEDAAAAGMLLSTGADRPYAIAVAVCDGVSTTGDAHTAAVAASKAGVEAMVAALAASRKARAAVLLGLAGAAEAAAAVGAGTDRAIGAVVHLHRRGSRSHRDGDCGDRRGQRRRQQGVLAACTAGTGTTADRRRLRGA